MKRALILTIAAIGVSAAPAMAETSGFYGNLGYTHVMLSDGNLGAIGGRVGYTLNDSFAIEGEANFGISDDVIMESGFGVTVELKHEVGAFAVGKLPVSESFEFLGRIGVVSAELEASLLSASASGSDTAVAYGVAGQYNFNESHGVRVGATGYGFDGIDAAIDVSYVVRF